MQLAVLLGLCLPAHAEFILSSAIVEFTATSPRQQDIELISRGGGNDYIVTEVSEVLNPGTASETRRPMTDPATAGLLATPDKTILAGGGRRIMRFVLLREPDDAEHIYRVAIKPVIRGVENDKRLGLKILVGYEVLVIVRPAVMKPAYAAARRGASFAVTNTGNTNILFHNGRQCAGAAADSCRLPAVIRVYPGAAAASDLPFDQPVSYTVWDGTDAVEKRYD